MFRIFLLALLVAAGPVRAGSSFSTDVTDLWWNPDESGWGVNLIQQHDTVFATFFVYDANGRAHWYVASALTASSATSSGATFQGDLFETQGPYFGVPFNPAAVGRDKVGTVTLQVAFPSTATLTYTVNGTSVTKAIRRQTWAANDASGTYDGARVILSGGGGTACGTGSSSFSEIQLAQSATGFSMNGKLAGAACRFTGNYAQDGHFGSSSGSFSCDNGIQGTYTLNELEASLYGFHARYNGSERGCTLQGRIGGVRTTVKRPPAE